MNDKRRRAIEQTVRRLEYARSWERKRAEVLPKGSYVKDLEAEEAMLAEAVNAYASHVLNSDTEVFSEPIAPVQPPTTPYRTPDGNRGASL